MTELLDAALGHLTAAGVEVARADPAVRVTFGGQTREYEVALRSRVSPASAHLAADRAVLLVAPYVSEAVGELLRGQGVPYADSVGNLWLRWDGLLLDVRGRKAPASPGPGAPGRPLRAFKGTGLKIVFALLARPGLIEESFRGIAEACAASVGTVHWVIKELVEAGFAGEDPARLYRTRELLDRWVEAYALDLAPRLALGRFNAPDPLWWTGADDALRAAHALWGGETAAHRLDPHLRPSRAVVYARQLPRQLILDQRLRKADGPGDVEIRDRFWYFPTGRELTVPTPLIYADLVAAADPRLAAAAADLRRSDALLRRLDGD